ncbi:MAG: ABC transporter permease [Aggregatilineales bacterium]
MKLRNILNIARVDLQVFFADRNNMVGLIVSPLIFTLVLGFAFGGGGGDSADSLIVDVIDLDGSDLSAQFSTDLRAINDTLILCPADNADDANCRLDDEGLTILNVEQARERVADEISSAAIVIPQGYGESVRNFTPIQIDYYSLADVTTGDPVLQSAQAIIQRINGGIISARIGEATGEAIGIYNDDLTQADFGEAVYTSATDQWQNPPVSVAYTLTDGTTENGIPTGFDQSVPGMATMFVMFTVLSGMQILLRERQTWTLQRLIMMPVTRADILGGKILSRFSIGIIQFVVIFAVGLLVGMNFGDNMLALLLVVAVYTLAITALSFALAPLFKDEFQAGTAVTLIALPLAALGGAWWPLEIVPDFMKVIGRISPVSWAMDGFNQITFYNGGWGDIVLPVVVLIGISIVLFAVGIVNFRTE